MDTALEESCARGAVPVLYVGWAEHADYALRLASLIHSYCSVERRQYRGDRHLMVIESSDAFGAHCDFEPSYSWDE